MRILVTGGAGFIGSNFVKMLVTENLPFSKIFILDSLTYAGHIANLTPVLDDSRIQFLEGDICNSQVTDEIMNQVDYVLNFAAESHVDRSITGASAFIQTNIFGTYTLLESAKKAGIARFLQISTDEVYGAMESGSASETSPLLPNSPYSSSKASADLLVRSYNKTYGLDVVTTRSSNNYGPNQFPEKLIPLFVTNCIEGKKLPLYGNGLNVRDWLHVSDHCKGIYQALIYGKSGEIYNLGGGTELNNLAIAHLIINHFNLDQEVIEYIEDRPGHDLRYSVNSSKAVSDIGYNPRVDFASGILETIHWYERNFDWWKPLKRQ